MDNPSPEGVIKKKGSKPTLPISLSTGLVALCNLSEDEAFKQVATAFCPLIGWVFAYAVRFGWNEFQQWRLERIINGWIAILENERALPHTNARRKREIDLEIAGHRKEIQKHQIDNFAIDNF